MSDAERNEFFDQVNAYYEELKKDPKAWLQFQEEQMLWDSISGDGWPDEV